MYTDFDNFGKYVFPEADSYQELLSGNKNANVLVVANGTKLDASNLEFLKKILAAINIDLDKDICLLKTVEGQSIRIGRLLKSSNVQKLLYFGVEPKQTGLNILTSLYKHIKIDQLDIVIAHSLSDISKDQNLKRNLWSILKEWQNG